MRPPLARESRYAPAITAESEPDADLAAEQLTIVVHVRKLPDPSQAFWKLPVAKSIRSLRIYI
eukprot:COSAG05_NODE_1730_length_4187_cov_126.370841_3_plen_63_part_00